MKIKLIIFASLLLVTSAYTCVAQVGPSKPNGPVGGKDVPNKLPPTVIQLPDLVVMTTKGSNLDNGEGSVMIKNQGKGASVTSDVELSISYGSQPAVSVVNAVPPIPPGGTQIITFDLNQSIVQAAFCSTVDSLKKVKESNEKNNRRCGLKKATRRSIRTKTNWPRRRSRTMHATLQRSRQYGQIRELRPHRHKLQRDLNRLWYEMTATD